MIVIPTTTMKQEEFIKRFTYDPTSDLLGEGGFGRVYKAYDNYEHEYVALKIQDVDPRYPELRLKNEVEKVQRHLHKNVARYKGCFTMVDYRGQTDVAIMKYYNDGSLDKLLAHGKLSHAEKCELLVEILEGIAYLHSEGIIHRDLKPQNVLIVQHEGRYWPLITDFGISKQLDEGQSSAVSNSVLGGTRAYASPEQLKERTIRKNTDLWSFGVIAYQMLVGKLPFDCGKYSATSEEGRQEQFRQMMSGLLPDAVATIPEPWQRLIRECLTVDNERRIAHAEDCLAIISGEEATAVAIEVDNPTTQLDSDSETAVEPEPQPEPKPEPQPEPKVAPKPEPKVAPKQEQKPLSTPKPTEPKKKSKWWLWLLLLAIVGGGVFAYLSSQPKDNPEPTPAPDPVLRLTSNSRDTVEHGGGNGINRYTLENPVSGVDLSVSDDASWLISVDASWLTTSRSGNTVSYSASANESQSSRTATITVNYGDQSFDVVVTQNGKPAPIYAVGDYYNVNGVEGVVFEISDGGRHGKIVSVDQAAEVSWGPEGVNAPADSETNGKANTDAIMALANRGSYPAFTWCRGKGPNWYLPALNELQAIYRNKDAINATLRAQGYTEISNRWYWSSTEFNEFSAWHVSTRYGYTSSGGKYYDGYVRAVSAF